MRALGRPSSLMSRITPPLRSRLSTRSVAHEIGQPIEEALFPGDRLKLFHPTHPGELLDGRFKTVAKLGFGGGSTVWLAENLNFNQNEESIVPRFVSIKIPALDTDASREATFLKIISNTEGTHDGLGFIHTPVDEFQLKGPMGTHDCLVYEPMRETLYDFQHQMKVKRLSLPLFKFFAFCLLHALDFLHTECRLVHTDIKDDNIMITIENESVLEDFVKHHTIHPQPRYVSPKDGHHIYLSQNKFGQIRGSRLLPMLSDFNLSLPGPREGIGYLSAIQSHRYRAPEVLLGCPWSYSVDIWNFGLLMWDLVEDTSLFGRPAGYDGVYDAHVHLAQIISLLGDPPDEVIKRERESRASKLKDPILNYGGTATCQTMNEFWGGPFFTDDKQSVRKDLVTERRSLADTVTGLSGDEKESFLDFASCMLQWLPEERSTAKELIQHPFFKEFQQDGERGRKH